ncbi:MAG: AMP-binding protein, partial [Clostridia bacterium]|nr:AMP-binding protein [Clostridia bacterium]
YEYIATMFGVLGGNGLVIPLDIQLSNENMVKNLAKADTDVLFYDWEFRSQVTYIMEHCKTIKKFICLQEVKGSDTVAAILSEPEKDTPLPEINPGECALIIFTSGTTGNAKGVMLSHANEIDNAFSADEAGDVIPPYEEVLLNVLPIHHIFCINNDIFMSVRYGMTVCLCRDLRKMMHSILLFEPTFIRMVPMMVKALINRFNITKKQNADASLDELKEMVWGKSLYRIGTGGGYLAPDLAQKFLDIGIRIGQGYGMSECSPKICVPDYNRPEKVASVGVPVRGCDIRIQDGEIQVKSQSVMLGYYKDEEQTKEAFTEDGYLRTGDLGYIDEDGFVFLTGRKKNLIIFENGENVSPEAIENIFDGELLIADILVYGKDNKIAAEVYPNFEYASVNGISDIISEVNRIVAEKNETLPTYSQIASVSVRKNPFEKTSSKKIIREKYFEDKEKAEEKAKSFRKPETELQQQIFDLVSQVIGNDTIGIDEDLQDYGLDSMSTVMLIEDFESKLGKSVTFGEIQTHRTIEAIEELFVESEGKPQIDYSPRPADKMSTTQNYFAYILRGNTTANLPFTFELNPEIDLVRLKAAIEDVIEAHPALKGIIKPGETKYLALFRDDSVKPDVPIVKLTDMEWETRKEEILVPFKYDGEDKLYHICIFETESSKYLLFDVAHIMGDGMTMNILIDDVNKRYMGLPVEKERFTFYEYLVDYAENEKNGLRKRDMAYYNELLKGTSLSRSVLNKKGKQNLKEESNGVIRRRFDMLNKKKIMYFCKKNGVSENVLFYTAFNYCVGLFSDLKELFTCSIHSGRTDSRYRRTAGPFFLTYYCRYNVVPHETVAELLRRTGLQIMDTMECYISVPKQSEMFFQYQGEIINIDEVGGMPAKRIHLQLDSMPFHMQVMTDDKGYFTETRYWKNRFDKEMIDRFLICYEYVVNAMLEEKSARMLKHHIPDEMFPMHYTVSAGELNAEAGHTMLKNVPVDTQVKVYVLDERYNKKPTGAWGRLYIKDYEPENVVDIINYPYQKGTQLYDTGITARILPDGSIDFLENSGRTVLTDGSRGRRYYDLGALERAVGGMNNIEECRAYMVYDDETGDMKLAMDVETSKDSFINKIRAHTEETFGEQLIPAVVNIISK